MPFVIAWFWISSLWGEPASNDADVLIAQHRQCVAFRAYEALKPTSCHVYYQFLAWWTHEKLSNGKLDPTGLLTKALLEDAAGFGGWSRDKRASAEESTTYSNAAFFHYWQHNNAASPQKNAILHNIWKAAAEKQCLLAPHRWLYRVGKEPRDEPKNVTDWYRSLRDMGWSMGKSSADTFLNQLFVCQHSSSFQKEVAMRLVCDTPEMLASWFDLSLGFAQGSVVRNADNPLEKEFRELLQQKPRMEDYKRCFQRVMEKQLPACLSFWHKMENVCITFSETDEDATCLGMFQLLLKNHKQRHPGLSMSAVMDDGQRKKLWRLGENQLPLSLLEEACSKHEDMDGIYDIFERGLSKLQNQRHQYGSFESANELMRLVADYLGFVHASNEICKYMVMMPGYIFGNFMGIGAELDAEQNNLADLHMKAYRVFQKTTGYLFSQIGQYRIADYRLCDGYVTINANTEGSFEDYNVIITHEEQDLLRRASDLSPDFYRFPPVVFRDRHFQKEHDARCNISKGDEATILRNTGRAIDFLIQRKIFPPYEKLRVLLRLQTMGML